MRKTGRTALLLLAALCITIFFAACGDGSGGEDGDDDIAGADWRTWGVIDAYGEISRDGTKTDICVCVDDESAAFYYDSAEQVYYDGVEFPMHVDNAGQLLRSIEFDDLDFDGCSDVTICFDQDDGGELVMIWLWSADAGYVFDDELSYTTCGEEEYEDSEVDYTGIWKPEGQELWLEIYDDGTWEIVNSDMDTVYSGSFETDGIGIELIEDSGETLYFLPESDDLLSGSDGSRLVRVG